MPDGAEPYAVLASWLGAERAELEDQRSRIDLQLEALAEIAAAVDRYRVMCESGGVEDGHEPGADCGQLTSAVLGISRTPPRRGATRAGCLSSIPGRV